MVRNELISLPPVNRREVARYAGIRQETPEVTTLLEEALVEAEPVLTGRVCWAEFPVSRREDSLDLGFAQVQSRDLDRALDRCHRIILFAATLGLGFDRLIARYSRLSPAKAVLLQAIGTERIEALCDTFCQSHTAAARFSPGYGDLPLALQREIFRVLDCPRQIGLTLNDSLLMSPSKSVTAILPLGTCPEPHSGCRRCGKTDCPYRRMP